MKMETRQTKNSTWCKDKFQTDRRGEDFDIHKYVKDVGLGEKGGEEEGYKRLQCFFTVGASEPKECCATRPHACSTLRVGNTGINMNELT